MRHSVGFLLAWTLAWLLCTGGIQAQTPAPFTVVIASVTRLSEAEQILARVPSADEALIVKATVGAGVRYRVGIGRFTDKPAAERQRLALVKLFPDAWLLPLGADTLLPEPRRTSPEAAPGPASLAGFARAYSALVDALEALDARRIQPLIHPELGLWVQHAAGRFTVAQRCTTFDEVLELTALESAKARRQFEDAARSYRITTPTLGDYPVKPCADADTARREAALIALPLGDGRITRTRAALKKAAMNAGLSDDEAAECARLERLQRMAVMLPNAPPIRRLYFAFADDRWYLTLIDLTCEP